MKIPAVCIVVSDKDNVEMPTLLPDSLRALLLECLDYAGLFPPARLPLEEAVRNFLHYRQEAEAWMLGRFVCPAGRLAELARLIDGHSSARPVFRISVLGSGGETNHEFLHRLPDDLRAVQAVQSGRKGLVATESFEVRLPDDALTEESGDTFGRLLDAAVPRFPAAGLPGLTLFFETPLVGDWRSLIGRVTAALGARNLPLDSNTGRIGFKLRTGGLEASAFPTAEQVAHVITACRDARVPWKATAGLHQPLTHIDEAVGVRAFGFLNVLAAAVLAGIHALDEEQVRPIVADEDAERFCFRDDGFAWQDLCASPERMAEARRDSMVSFGSCSFDEPRDGLRTLGVLRDGSRTTRMTRINADKKNERGLMNPLSAVIEGGCE